MIIEVGTLELLNLLDNGTTAQKIFSKQLTINEFEKFIEEWEEIINEDIQCNPSNYEETLSRLDIRGLLNGGVLYILTVDEIKKYYLEGETEDLEPYEIMELYADQNNELLITEFEDKAIFLQ